MPEALTEVYSATPDRPIDEKKERELKARVGATFGARASKQAMAKSTTSKDKKAKGDLEAKVDFEDKGNSEANQGTTMEGLVRKRTTMEAMATQGTTKEAMAAESINKEGLAKQDCTDNQGTARPGAGRFDGRSRTASDTRGGGERWTPRSTSTIVDWMHQELLPHKETPVVGCACA